MSGAHGWRRRDARADYERHHGGPNMTPMVDVVMVILIFFMASTVILGPEMLLAAGLEDPAEQSPAADPRFSIGKPIFEVTLASGPGGATVSGLGLTDARLDELGPAARSLAAEAGVGNVRMILSPADDVPYEAVILAQDTLREAGFTSIGLR